MDLNIYTICNTTYEKVFSQLQRYVWYLRTVDKIVKFVFKWSNLQKNLHSVLQCNELNALTWIAWMGLNKLSDLIKQIISYEYIICTSLWYITSFCDVVYDNDDDVINIWTFIYKNSWNYLYGDAALNEIRFSTWFHLISFGSKLNVAADAVHRNEKIMKKKVM